MSANTLHITDLASGLASDALINLDRLLLAFSDQDLEDYIATTTAAMERYQECDPSFAHFLAITIAMVNGVLFKRSHRKESSNE